MLRRLTNRLQPNHSGEGVLSLTVLPRRFEKTASFDVRLGAWQKKNRGVFQGNTASLLQGPGHELVGPLVPVPFLNRQLTFFKIIKGVKKCMVFTQTKVSQTKNKGSKGMTKTIEISENHRKFHKNGK